MNHEEPAPQPTVRARHAESGPTDRPLAGSLVGVAALGLAFGGTAIAEAYRTVMFAAAGLAGSNEAVAAATIDGR